MIHICSLHLLQIQHNYLSAHLTFLKHHLTYVIKTMSYEDGLWFPCRHIWQRKL